jgi:hypothetical protein
VLYEKEALLLLPQCRNIDSFFNDIKDWIIWQKYVPHTQGNRDLTYQLRRLLVK